MVERHNWETSGSRHQLQFPKLAHSVFFGNFVGQRDVRIFAPPAARVPTNATGQIAYYRTSETIRINRVLQLGHLHHACVFLEERKRAGTIGYDLWWFEGAQARTILRRPWGWQQGRTNQHGPGRFWAILKSGPRTPAAIAGYKP